MSPVREAVRARGAADQPPEGRAQVQVALGSQEIQASLFASTNLGLISMF